MEKKIKTILICLLIILNFGACKQNQENQIYAIDIYINKEHKLVKEIRDRYIIGKFESQIKKSSRQNYFKNPGGFKFFLKCYSENGIQNITIKENLISTKHGMYETDINLYELFLIKPLED